MKNDSQLTQINQHENSFLNLEFLPPGVVEYKVPPGVDEYNSGNWLASVTRTRFDGIVCAWEHAWRAIGDADIFSGSKRFFFFFLV